MWGLGVFQVFVALSPIYVVGHFYRALDNKILEISTAKQYGATCFLTPPP